MKKQKILFIGAIILFCLIAIVILVPNVSNAANSMIDRLRGRILLQVENHGEAWYVSPLDGKRYFIGAQQDLIKIIKKLGLGISNLDLAQIPIGDIDNISAPDQTTNYTKLVPSNFLVRSSNDIFNVSGNYVSPKEGGYVLGNGKNFLFKAKINKPDNGCKSLKFTDDFQNFEDKTIEIKFKRSTYGGFDIQLANESGQILDFVTDSNDVPSNLVRLCNAYNQCDLVCNDYAGGWIGSEFDWGQLVNDGKLHILKIAKTSNSVIFDLDNGKKTKFIYNMSGCGYDMPVSNLNFKGKITLKIEGWSCLWKSDAAHLEVDSVLIR